MRPFFFAYTVLLLFMGKFQKILLIANLVIVLAGTGVVFYSHFMIKPEPTDQDQQTLDLVENAQKSTEVKAIPIKKFVVNLHSRQTRLRYLDIEMNVLPFYESQSEIIKQNEHLFKDSVIEISSRLSPDDLNTLSGKILLESRIKKQVNTKLGQPVVKQIYFSGFVVQ